VRDALFDMTPHLGVTKIFGDIGRTEEGTVTVVRSRAMQNF
jgi:hypothetical protein